MSVFGFVPTRDEPAECLPWTRRTGVCRYPPCPAEMYVSTADEGGLGRTYDDLSHHWNSKVARDRSGPSSQPFRQGTR